MCRNAFPVITLLPPPIRLANGSLVASTGTPGANLTLELEYGRPAPIALTACEDSTLTLACAAIATDAEDGDLTAEIVIEDVTPCLATQDPNTCIKCSASQLSVGACIPGLYTLRYRVCG